jgi:large subunit ribosomal protein L25
MSSELIELKAIDRGVGTGKSRAMRRKGYVTCSVYGDKKEQLFFSLTEKDVTNLYRKGYFTSTIFLLTIGDKSIKVLPHAVDLHPITDLVTNVDFLYVKSDVQEVKIPILFEGKDTAIGVKRGGFFNVTKRKIKISCTNGNIPKFISIDVSDMQAGFSLRVSQKDMPEGCTLLEKDKGKDDIVVASILGKVVKEVAEGAAPAAQAKGK